MVLLGYKKVIVPLEWIKKRDKFARDAVLSNRHCHMYFQLIAKHAKVRKSGYKIIPLFSLALLLRPRNIVELGAAFTYYPEGYPSRWGVCSKKDEGLVSTRVLLAACRFLNGIGIPARLTSIDIRKDDEQLKKCKAFLEKLGLLEFWNPVYGTDSLTWLRGNREKIDIAYVDSAHTYKQVRDELEILSPLMSEDGLIVVDDGFTINDSPKASWRIDEDEQGRSSGGEFGAILYFLEKHGEWFSRWSPEGTVYLCRNKHILELFSYR